MLKRSKIILVILAGGIIGATTIAAVLLWRTNLAFTPLVADQIDDLSPTNVAIVFGAGLVNNSSRPSDMLYDRLQTAADIYHAGKASIILVSGDNRFEHYSEPDVMRRTLIEDFDVPTEAIHSDHAGRRTYDTCARAHELWGVRRAILVTQDYHLPRALMTCCALGIDGQGASSSLRTYRFEQRYHQREMLAILKAYVDIYLWHPDYLGGPQEATLDE